MTIVRLVMMVGLAMLVMWTQAGETCYTIHKDSFWPPWGGHMGVKLGNTIKARIKLDPNTATYIIPETQDTHRCQGSWNKLYGASRCASLHHHDSDRFVWRRALTCWRFEGRKVVEIPNCPDAGKLQIAAYAYDDWQKPFEHENTLLKIFKTMAISGHWYTYEINTLPTQTIYKLYDDNNNLLETQAILHRSCWFTNVGYDLGFYFGGACPAPRDVTACYNYL